MRMNTIFRKKEIDGMHFHSRKKSKKGVAGFVLSLFGVVLVLVLCVLATLAEGEAGLFVGIGGLCAMLICGVAFWLCLQGLKERDVYTKIPFAGLIVSGAMFVLLFCLYVAGIKF